MGAPPRNFAWLVKHHFGKVRAATFAAALVPAFCLVAEWWTDALGVNPLNRLLQFTGRWALIMLIITLAITPVRRFTVWLAQSAHARYGKRVSDWNWLVRLRRQLGLFTFLYACLHLAVYVCLDAGADLQAIVDDVAERPFILVGFAAFGLLIPLAATSNKAAMRALGGRAWQRLHRLAYVIAGLSIVHFWLEAKVGEFKPLPYSMVLGLLLLARLQSRWGGGRRVPENDVTAR